MALSPHKFRELVFQILYSHDFAGEEDEMVPFLMKHHEVSKKGVFQAKERVEKILEQLKELDALISEFSQDYAFDRISRVEKNLLRLSAFELLFDSEIPPKVAIAEAIRLGRKFATPEGAGFVNGVLDAIYKKRTEV